MKFKSILLLLILMSTSVTRIYAYDGIVDGICYNFTDNEAMVTYYSSDFRTNRGYYTGDINIPESVKYNDKSYKVVAIDQKSFNSCSRLNSVIIPSSITSIGNNAFDGCTTITSIDIPSSVTFIGKSAFYECSELNSISIPNTVARIGSAAFHYTKWFNNQPDGPLYIGKVFYFYKGNMPENTSINIEDGTIGIAGGAFYTHSNLVSIVMPNSLVEIEEGAFWQCRNLSSIDLSEKVTVIRNQVFQECKSLKSINLSNITSIGNYAFSECESLQSISFCDNLESIGIGAFQKCNSIVNLTIPNSVIELSKNAFSSCKRLKSVNIGNGVKELRDAVFGNTEIASLIIGTGLESISKTAIGERKPTKVFWMVNNVPKNYMEIHGMINYHVSKDGWTTDGRIWTPYQFLSSKFEVGGVTYIPTSMTDRTCDAVDCKYDNSASLIEVGPTVTYKGVTFTVNKIQRYAFTNNDSILEATIGANEDIGIKAFYDCKSLKTASIDIKGKILESAFQGCSALQAATFGKEVSSIGPYAFQECSSLQNVDIPDAVTSIGKFAFSGCSSISSAKTGTGLSIMEMGLFLGCSSLKDVQIGPNVTTINSSVFNGCSELPYLFIPKSVTDIDAAFGCSKLKEVIFEDGDDVLRMSSSFSSSPLDSVYIGRTLSFSNSPFKDNSSLRAVKLGDKQTEVIRDEFFGCKNLQNFYMSNLVTAIGNQAFSGCAGLKSFLLGSNVKTIGQKAFTGCANITKLICLAVTPPVCDYLALDDINKWECTLEVPMSGLEAYKVADQWKEFFFINGFDTGIMSIVLDKWQDGKIYNLKGQKLNQMNKGVNIINGRKVLIK